ncbi:MAG: hypothetical protein CML17_02395 [Pusillimonas sp.]|jgi:hypothetical protein|nr:hypothetical protein [Pusillimonas sp.]|tara:strand:- start:346 stop:546 length:201 start_codon:yes stop_codon:yes gene_type:complete
MEQINRDIIAVLTNARENGYRAFCDASNELSEAFAIIGTINRGEQNLTDYLCRRIYICIDSAKSHF